jgi:hypothetical protein
LNLVCAQGARRRQAETNRRVSEKTSASVFEELLARIDAWRLAKSAKDVFPQSRPLFGSFQCSGVAPLYFQPSFGSFREILWRPCRISEIA